MALELSSLIPAGLKDVTARIGGALALTALTVFLFDLRGIQLSNSIYLAGAYGFYFALVSFAIFLYTKLERWNKRQSKRRQRRTFGLDNLKVCPDEFMQALKYLKQQNTPRFRADLNHIDLLHRMEREALLEIDDPNFSVYAPSTYLKVPRSVWKRLDDIPWDRPIADRPPWIAHNRRI